MECELAASKDYYLLSTDITKTLILSRDKRPLPSKEYLDKSYNIYVKLYENSQMLNMRKLRAGFDISVGSLTPPNTPCKIPSISSVRTLLENEHDEIIEL